MTHPDITPMGGKEVHWWDSPQRYKNEIYDFERYLDLADIGADHVLRNLRMCRRNNTIYHPVIFGEGTPSTMFKNTRWERFVVI